MQITKGAMQGPVKVLIYGPEGIGKSTLASHFPDPLFIDTEGSTKWMDVARLPAPETWNDILEEVKYVYENPDCCKTLVIDTGDWAESLCIAELTKTVSSIEDFGYGKGYVMLAEKFKKLLDELDKVIAAGVHVVITAHAQMRKFEQPDEMGAYDRWELKLQKKTAPLVKEWSDMILFCNFKTYVVETKDKKKKAMGGERVMYTTHHNCWDAKNRFGLSSPLQMSYDAISQVIGADLSRKVLTDFDRIPDNLRLLMEKDGVDEWSIQTLAVSKGWVSDGMLPVYKYPQNLLAFLVKDWGKVKEAISKQSEEVPFNE